MCGLQRGVGCESWCEHGAGRGAGSSGTEISTVEKQLTEGKGYLADMSQSDGAVP